MGKYIESDIQIRFADADSLGHINNVNLQHYFDVGKMEFYEKVLGKTIDPDAESLIPYLYTPTTTARAGSIRNSSYGRGWRR